MKYAIIGVEGPQDQAFTGKVLKLLGFKDFREALKGLESNLDPFWRKFIPVFPKKGNLYKRLDMPSILFNDTLSVAIYAGEGSNLGPNLEDILVANPEYQTNLAAFAIVADCDRSTPIEIVAKYSDRFRKYFPNFANQAGVVDPNIPNIPRTGIYVLPDNNRQGVLDTLLCECGNIVYPEIMNCAIAYLNGISEEKKTHWRPFDEQKALVATVVSVLKPGKTNTTSIADNNWVSKQVQQQVPALANFVEFLRQLLELS